MRGGSMKDKLLVFIDLIGGILSLGLLLASYFIKDTWWQTVSMSISINVLTSLLLLNLVDRLLDKQSIKKEQLRAKKQEKNAILNYHKMIEALLDMYIQEFNQLTIPISKRTKDNVFTDISNSSFNNDFEVSDLRDFAHIDILPFNVLGETIIYDYKDIFNRLCAKFYSLFTNCSFEYFPQMRDVLCDILKESDIPNGIDSLISFTKWQKREQVLTTLADLALNYSGNPDKDLANCKYNGNLFINIILLYNHLTKMYNLMKRYKQEIERIIADAN